MTVEEEENFPVTSPDISEVLSPDKFKSLIAELHLLRQADVTIPPGLCSDSQCGGPALAQIADELRQALNSVNRGSDSWRLNIVAISGAAQSETWRSLITAVRETERTASEYKPNLLIHQPKCVKKGETDELVKTCREMEAHLRAGKKLTASTLLFKGQWKALLEHLEVADGRPTKAEHFEAIRMSLVLGRLRSHLRRLWNGLMAEVNGPQIPETEPAPEEWSARLLPDVENLLSWQSSAWAPVHAKLTDQGISVNCALLSVSADTSPAGQLKRTIMATDQVLLPSIEKLQIIWRLRQAEEKLKGVILSISQFRNLHADVPLFVPLESAASTEDVDAYGEILTRLTLAFGKREAVVRRRAILAELDDVAPDWAVAILTRNGIHGQCIPPTNYEAAWRWKQLDAELRKRGRTSVQELIQQIEQTRSQVEEITSLLVESMAWSEQFKRVDLRMRQALIGFVSTLRRIGGGTGRRVPKLLIQAQEQMATSQEAVPVWIMPLARVAEVFDLGKNRFDVVIIDEASQLDLTGLIALYMAREIVIVGDHEQVEPLAVGEKVDDVQALIDEYLQGIPNAQLWDGRQSVYELGRASFEAVPLREHFRCVPDIIRFSNRLSYNGRILPLREDSKVLTRPFVVAHYVADATAEKRTNPREAQALVSLMAAACEQPEYMGKTFGVVSMVGEDNSEQVRLIQTLAREHIGELELENRRFHCGNSAQFQGDERDVMMLSLIDTPDPSGPLPTRSQDLYKKRFNVAASRARDQMWVIYSLDPNRDLKPKDLRRELIEFALNPRASEEVYEEKRGTTESEFEDRVLRHLAKRGYTNVQTQYKVGAYRLDFVVSGQSNRVAIECDGDRFHTLDNLEQDMMRQTTLERLGWKFIRIRGSAFFRNEQEAMDGVCDLLGELDILPGQFGDVETELSVSTGLLHRVQTRAQELVLLWNGKIDGHYDSDSLKADLLSPVRGLLTSPHFGRNELFVSRF